MCWNVKFRIVKLIFFFSVHTLQAACPHKLFLLHQNKTRNGATQQQCVLFISENRSTMFSDTDWHKGITWNSGPECSYKEEKECGDTMDCWNGEQCCCSVWLSVLVKHFFLFSLNWIDTFSLLHNDPTCELLTHSRCSLALRFWLIDMWCTSMVPFRRTKCNCLSIMDWF